MDLYPTQRFMAVHDPPNKWYYLCWITRGVRQYGLNIDWYGWTFACPLFSVSYFSKAYREYACYGLPKFGWGIWRRRDIVEGDFLYRWHS